MNQNVASRGTAMTQGFSRQRLFWILVSAFLWSHPQQCAFASSTHSQQDLLPQMENTDHLDMTCALGACFVESKDIAELDDSLPSVRLQQILEEDCRNVRNDCEDRAQECSTNALIAASCPETCQEDCLSRMEPLDNTQNIQDTEEANDPKYIVQEGAGADFGVLQLVPPLTLDPVDKKNPPIVSRDRILQHAHEMAQFMHNRKEIPQSSTTTICRNNHYMCLQWAVVGECENNTHWMLENCGPACLYCS